MTDLAELIARVEGATGPDRELDALIWAHFNDRDIREHNGMLLAKKREPPHDECVLGWIDPGKHSRNFSLNGVFEGGKVSGSVKASEPVTSSIDAALALVERKLPSRPVGFLPHFYKEHAYAGIIGEPGKAVDLLKAEIAGAPTPALAICLALLRSLQAGAQN